MFSYTTTEVKFNLMAVILDKTLTYQQKIDEISKQAQLVCYHVFNLHFAAPRNEGNI